MDDVNMVNVVSVVVLFACLLHVTIGQFLCPVFFQPWGHKCYKFQGDMHSLNTTAFTCANFNAASIPLVVADHNEAAYLVDKFVSLGFDTATHDGFWLRCQDDVTEGQWTCEGSSNYWNSDSNNSGFWDWMEGEPNGGTAENCLVLDFDGKLRDVPCQLVTSFNAGVCEITMTTPAPEVSTAKPTTPEPVTSTSKPVTSTAAAAVPKLKWHTECYTDPDGFDYRGHVSTTQGGKTCQKWTSQSPHAHTRTPERYPDAGLGDHNFCRNPDGQRLPWCYTTSGKRWDLCDIGEPKTSCSGRWYHYDGGNSCLENFEITSFITSSLPQCSFQCKMRDHCLSFNWQKSDKDNICTLNSAERDGVPVDNYVPVIGCRYFYPI